MTDVTYRYAVRQEVSDRDESWFVVSVLPSQKDFSSFSTVKEIARELANMAISAISEPGSSMEKKCVLSVNMDFGDGYARAEVKYVAKCNNQVSCMSVMALLDHSIPVIPQNEIIPTVFRLRDVSN